MDQTRFFKEDRSHVPLKRGAFLMSLSAVLAGLSLVGWIFYTGGVSFTPEPVPVRLMTVKRGTVENIINESGVVELGNQQTLKAPADGAVDQVLAKVGDRLNPGQPVLLLRDPLRQTSLAQHRLKIQQLQVDLSRQRQRVLKEREDLAIAREEIQLCPHELNEGNQSQLLSQGFLVSELCQKLSDNVRNAKLALTETEAAVHRIDLAIQEQQLAGQALQERLQNNVVTAPTRSVVLDVLVQQGEAVELKDPLLVLGDPTQEVVRLQLSTLKADKVKPNQVARIRVIGPNNEVFTGRVERLSLLASSGEISENQTVKTQNSGQPRLETMIRLDAPTGTLIPGSYVSVDIVLAQQKDGLLLDEDAIQDDGQAPFVWIQDDQDKAQQRPVKLGLKGLSSVAVTSGLQPGDNVILPTGDIPLKSGIPVQPESLTPTSEP